MVTPMARSWNRSSRQRQLFHLNPMGPRRTGRKCRIEVEVEAPIELEVLARDLDDVYTMIPFEVDLAEVVLVEEIVGDDQAFVVVGKVDIVRPGIDTEVDDGGLHRVLGVAHIEHAHLPGLE